MGEHRHLTKALFSQGKSAKNETGPFFSSSENTHPRGYISHISWLIHGFKMSCKC